MKLLRRAIHAAQLSRVRSMSKLVSPYVGPLHGIHRGEIQTPPEPSEVWYAVLASCLPFRDRSILVAPEQFRMDDTESRASMPPAVRRGKEHFADAHFLPLQKQAVVTNLSTPLSSHTNSSLATANTSSSVSLVLGAKNKVSTRRDLFSRFPSNTADVVVFCSNAFQEVIEECPVVMTECHRVLQHTGVMCLWGHIRCSAKLVSSVPGLAENFDELKAFLVNRKWEDARLGEQGDRGMNEEEEKASVPKVHNISHSSEIAHEDIYFPFLNVQRRFFVSEYGLTLPQLVAFVRGWPEYSSWVKKHSRKVYPNGRGCSGAVCVEPDPLEGLLHCTYGALRPDEDIHDVEVRLQLSHFVLSADNRGVTKHTISDTSKSRSRLPQ